MGLPENLKKDNDMVVLSMQTPWHLTFAFGRIENLGFLIEIICWASWISQVQSTGLPSIFL